jgi:hypothetical protein
MRTRWKVLWRPLPVKTPSAETQCYVMLQEVPDSDDPHGLVLAYCLSLSVSLSCRSLHETKKAATITFVIQSIAPPQFPVESENGLPSA